MRHLHALDPRHEVPPTDLVPVGTHRAEPFIYSQADVAGLVAAADQFPHPLMAAAYRTYIGLLAVDRDQIDSPECGLSHGYAQGKCHREILVIGVVPPSVVSRPG